MSDYPDDINDSIKANVSEHYTNYAIILLEEDGGLHVDYSNPIIGKALIVEALKIMIKLDRNPIIYFEHEPEEEEDLDE